MTEHDYWVFSLHQPPLKRKTYTPPQLSKRPKKRRHQARTVKESTDSDDEKASVSVKFTNKENELNEIKSVNSTIDENESYESDMVEKVMMNTIKALSAVSTNEVIASVQDSSIPNQAYHGSDTCNEEPNKLVRDNEFLPEKSSFSSENRMFGRIIQFARKVTIYQK